MAIGWHGKLVRLVPVDVDRHLENAFRWINDSEVTQHLLVGDFPLTKLAERDWMESRSKPNETEIAFAIETLQGKHVGFSGIHNISWRNGYGTTGTLIGDISEWGRGFGTDAALVRNRYAFDVLGLRMLYSEVLEGNTASERMLKKAGYVECGRMPKRIWKRGDYRDEILLCLDRSSWLKRLK